ncbi:MAG: dTDP-3-amino-3,4,6-trideoxy-alpha-D-glucose transaminase [Fimbriimonadaceae bacterium]|nr:dTDP-3-amino-3,4,6-trideoxy-alpha-D-glucose transaminase [Fimbriimonadaceae bacterium]
MRVPFVDTKSQYEDLKSELDSVVLDILASGAYVVGKHNRAFEEAMAARHGVKHAIAVNSGTDAQRIAMQAADIGPGDEVITSAFTFVASVETILQLGATPVFVDIDPMTFNLDPEQVEAAITSRTKAVVPIHLYGQLADMVRINDIANRHGLLVIEDAAQAIDSHHRGVFAGNFGIAASLSFYVTKNLGAAGDGGMILTNDPEIDRRSRSLRIHGMGRERYYYDEVGYTSRLDELQAAILNTKLTKLADWNDRRSRLASIYDNRLRDCPITLPKTLAGNNHTYHQYTVRCDRRDGLQQFLKEREVDSMIYYPVPIHFHEPYKAYGGGPGSLPETERAALEVLSLPIQAHLADDQVEFAAQSITEYLAVVGAS